MATLDNAAIVREMYSAWNQKDMDRLASFATADARVTSVPSDTKLGFREDAEVWASAFPDGEIQVLNLVAQGDYVIAECVGRGTHTGALRGPAGDIPATGRRLELPFVDCHKFRNGKITETRLYFDTGSMMAQLGLSAGTTATQRATAPSPEHRH
jgi:steroid delta-isomerase-like uncharacterized protein